MGVTRKWHDIGLELLNDAVVLDEITENYPKNINKCCTEMFKRWLEREPDANWDKLVTVLMKVELKTAAENIKSEFSYLHVPDILALTYHLLSV